MYLCWNRWQTAQEEAEAEAAQEYYENRYPMREIYRIAGGQEIFDYILIYE